MSKPSFLILAANTPWVYALADALSEKHPATAMRFYDFSNWKRLRPTWPLGHAALRRVMLVMPPGFAGKLEPVFRPILRWRINAERRSLRAQTGADPYVIAPFPYLEPWLADVPDDRLIYYSLDEYAFYDPPRSARTHRREDALIGRAAHTICLSRYQADVLRTRNSTRSQNIRHFPLGVDATFINPAPELPPVANRVGYIGTLSDRVDWHFVEAVATIAPTLTFQFVGAVEPNDAIDVPDWVQARARVFALPNVDYVGSVPQSQVKNFYWASAVNWMPYDSNHGFNLAACPTKIMDAIASGRPFASTDVPECRLYPEFVQIAHDARTMADLLADLVAHPRPDAATLIAFARDQQWSKRADTLLAWL